MLEKARALVNRPPGPSLPVARIYARMGKRKEARQILDAVPKTGSHVSLATVYAALGDKGEAFRLLFENIEVHDGLAYVKTDPRLASLHSDPRWPVLLRSM